MWLVKKSLVPARGRNIYQIIMCHFEQDALHIRIWVAYICVQKKKYLCAQACRNGKGASALLLSLLLRARQEHISRVSVCAGTRERSERFLRGNQVHLLNKKMDLYSVPSPLLLPSNDIFRELQLVLDEFRIEAATTLEEDWAQVRVKVEFK